MSTDGEQSKSESQPVSSVDREPPVDGEAQSRVPAEGPVQPEGQVQPGAGAPGNPRSARGRPATPVLVMAVLLALAVIAATIFGVLLIRQSAADRAGAEALATAQAYAVTVTTYDYQNLDRNFADVLDGATGEFKDQYAGASRTLRQLISGAKSTSKGTVLAAGIQSQSTDQVVVLVFVDQTITNAVAPQPKIDRTRVVMTLTPHDGRWLVGKLELQ